MSCTLGGGQKGCQDLPPLQRGPARPYTAMGKLGEAQPLKIGGGRSPILTYRGLNDLNQMLGMLPVLCCGRLFQPVPCGWHLTFYFQAALKEFNNGKMKN